MSSNNYVIFLMGPTGAGKTQLAIELVQRLPCDIISVDSAMVYRGMDIGTAKPDAGILAVAPHRLIDVCDPAEPYSAAQFRQDASHHIEAILAQGRIPLLVGGTMLYYRALAQGLSVLPAADAQVRRQLEQEAEQQGWAALHQRLQQVDPLAAERIHPNDPQRIQRALEIFQLTGQTMSALLAQASAHALPYRIVRLIVAPAARVELHERINQRFESMMSIGFLAEVERLHQRGDLHAGLPSIRAVGYRQLWEHLEGLYDLPTAIARGKTATRQLAKRQLTWLRGDTEAKWFDAAKQNMIDKVLNYLHQAQ